jgi:hypothetical protein
MFCGAVILDSLQPQTPNTGGDGGAIFIGTGALTAIIDTTAFVTNTATGRGGAVSIMALSGIIDLQNLVATGNAAGRHLAATQLLSMASFQASSPQSEGGALHIGGGSMTLLIVNSTLGQNEAAKVSHTLTLQCVIP